MDLCTDGRTVVVVTSVGVYLYVRRPRESFAEAFARQPAFLELGGNIEAEAVTLSQDGDTIFVTVEGQGAAIFRFDRE